MLLMSKQIFASLTQRLQKCKLTIKLPEQENKMDSGERIWTQAQLLQNVLSTCQGHPLYYLFYKYISKFLDQVSCVAIYCVYALILEVIHNTN